MAFAKIKGLKGGASGLIAFAWVGLGVGVDVSAEGLDGVVRIGGGVCSATLVFMLRGNGYCSS